MLENLQCDWIKTVLKRKVGQNSFTMVWKTYCQFSQMFKKLVAQPVFHSVSPSMFWWLLYLHKSNNHLKTAFYLPWLFLSNLKVCFDDLKDFSFKYAKTKKLGRGLTLTDIYAHVQNTSPRRCPGSIIVRCPNQLDRLFSIWGNSSTTESLSWITELHTLFLSVSPRKMNKLCIERDSLFFCLFFNLTKP